jgi:hypothetical protein
MLAARRTVEPPVSFCAIGNSPGKVWLHRQLLWSAMPLVKVAMLESSLTSKWLVLKRKAKKISAIDACSRRERSIGEHLYWTEMNPDGLHHKVVYRCGRFVVGSSFSEAHSPAKRAARFLG